MSGFVIAIVIIFVVISAFASKKQKQARSQQAEPTQQPAPQPVPNERHMHEPLTPRVTQHVVSPSFVSGHAHQETSMTGTEACAPVSAVAVAADNEKTAPVLVSASDAVRGIVLAEILGKPKALQKR